MAGLFLLTGVLTYASYLILNELDEKLLLMDTFKKEWDNFWATDEPPAAEKSVTNSTLEVSGVPPAPAVPPAVPPPVPPAVPPPVPPAVPPAAPPAAPPAVPPPAPAPRFRKPQQAQRKHKTKHLPLILSTAPSDDYDYDITTQKSRLRKRKKGSKDQQKHQKKHKKQQQSGIADSEIADREFSNEEYRRVPNVQKYEMPKRVVKFKIEDISDEYDYEEIGLGLKKRQAQIVKQKKRNKKHTKAKNKHLSTNYTRVVRHKGNNKRVKVGSVHEHKEYQKLKIRNNVKKPVREVKRREPGTLKSTQMLRQRNQKPGLYRQSKNSNKRIRPKTVKEEDEED